MTLSTEHHAASWTFKFQKGKVKKILKFYIFLKRALEVLLSENHHLDSQAFREGNLSLDKKTALKEPIFQGTTSCLFAPLLQFEKRFAAWCLQVAKSALSYDGWRHLSVTSQKISLLLLLQRHFGKMKNPGRLHIIGAVFFFFNRFFSR